MATDSLTILGTSAGAPLANRANSGYVIRVNDRLSLIDCGGSTCQSFIRLGFDPLTLDRIIISHTHPDHVIELPLFIQMVYLTKRSEPLYIYVPGEFIEPLKRLLSDCYLFESKFPFELIVNSYDFGDLFENPFDLEAIPNTHLAKYHDLIEDLKLPNLMQSCSFDIIVNNTKVLYSADIGLFDDILPHLDGHDYVILEAAHIEWEHFYEHVNEAKVGQYIISHLVSEQQAVTIKQEAKAKGLTNLVIAYDGMVIDLK